jgi:hypothetical protein
MNFLLIVFLLLGIIITSYIFLYKDKKIQTECEDGYYGSECQYSNVKTCNNRGKVLVDDNDNYTCKCSGNYDGKNCQKCKKGYQGSKCQFSDFYCNNNGKVRVDIYDNPVCDCNINLGWKGPNCQINDLVVPENLSSRCNNKGYFDPQARTCLCLPGYYGMYSCAYDNSYCNNNGIITDISEDSDSPLIECRCNEGFKGSKCQFNEQTLCNGRGKLIVDSGDVYKCECSGNYDGKNCEKCKPGFFGEKENCKYSDITTCNGGRLIFELNPTPQPSTTPNPPYKIACICPEGNLRSTKRSGKKSGSRCQLDDNTICNNRGYIINVINENTNPVDVECSCIDGYTGKYCQIPPS